MSLTDIKQLKKEKGFTIVELLIVIVVIAILAAIVLVAYNGITNRANTSRAQSNAVAVQKVAETINADNGNYPATIAAFTTGSATTRLPAGVTIVSSAVSGGAFATTATRAQADIPASNYTTIAVYMLTGGGGGVIYYRDGTGTITTSPLFYGSASSTSTTFTQLPA